MCFWSLISFTERQTIEKSDRGECFCNCFISTQFYLVSLSIMVQIRNQTHRRAPQRIVQLSSASDWEISLRNQKVRCGGTAPTLVSQRPSPGDLAAQNQARHAHLLWVIPDGKTIIFACFLSQNSQFLEIRLSKIEKFECSHFTARALCSARSTHADGKCDGSACCSW